MVGSQQTAVSSTRNRKLKSANMSGCQRKQAGEASGRDRRSLLSHRPALVTKHVGNGTKRYRELIKASYIEVGPK